MQLEITKEIAQKVLTVVDAGLSNGLGQPTLGNMCVEAAVCFALGLPHGDDPECVDPMLRSLKIRLNDSSWSSKEARAKGLRRLAVIQLGSKDQLDQKEFRKRLVDHAIRVSTPLALRSAASVHKDPVHVQALRDAANRCEKEGTEQSARDARIPAADAAYAASAADAADAADAAAYAAAARDKSLADYAEAVVQMLVEMKVPGAQWLELTEVAA